MNKKMKIPWYKKGDIDAGLGTFFDSFGKIIIAVPILTGVLNMPEQLVFGKIIAATGFTVFIFSLFNTLFARSLGKQTQNGDITALVGGISGTTLFVWLNAIMLPTYFVSRDPIFAWSVTLGVSLMYSVLQLILSFVFSFIFKFIPREALMGATVGGALTWMILSPLGEAFTTPWVIIPTLFILFTFYFGEIKPKFGSPALIAIGIGTIIAWISGVMHVENLRESFASLNLYLPSFQFGLITNESLQIAINYLPLILAYLLAELTADMQAFAQAEESQEIYPARTALVGLALSNLAGSLLGNPFLLNYYWGHPAWKKAEAGVSYPFFSGMIHLILCLTGLVAVVTSLIPVSASLVMLVYIGIVTGAGAFATGRKRYYGAMMFGVAIPLFELVNNKVFSIVNIAGKFTENGSDLINQQTTDSLAGISDGSASIVAAKLAEAGYAEGFITLAQGAMTIAILYASIIYLIIDRNWLKTSVFFFVTTVFSFFGLIHAKELTVNANPALSLCYLSLTITFLIIWLISQNRRKKNIIK
ncbi:MAG: hypothetical protein ACOX3H_01225 [Saccharofermentanales bacterium]|jgi:AGZA family xanthine/uracil permease-like MFS transporter